MLSLCNLHKLQHLSFEFLSQNFCIDADSTLWGKAGFVLPRHLRTLGLVGIRFSYIASCISTACLPNLTTLYLHVAAIDQKGLEFLGSLRELCILYLFMDSTATLQNICASNNGYFQKLRFCQMPLSMIHFRCNEGDSSVSFHIWNCVDAMLFGSSNNDHN